MPRGCGRRLRQILRFESELRALCVFVVKFHRLSAIGYWLFAVVLLLPSVPFALADDQVAAPVESSVLPLVRQVSTLGDAKR